LDLSVNILTNHAVNKNKILVFGGDQLRPNLHIQDYADLCKLLLTAPDEKVANESAPASVERISSSNQEVTSSATNDDDDDDERGPRYEQQRESLHL
jgi:nucleoside-diphosphate-sugar epimerase